ncbi:MAG: hypothetical protein FWE63_08840, partial [Bacteroidales bacterium]|nr:hypothetical protein [Bacteroidales bacterium]
MSPPLKIALNVLIFLLIAGFGYYMIHSLMSKGETSSTDVENQGNTFVSPYKKINSFEAESEIQCFAVS